MARSMFDEWPEETQAAAQRPAPQAKPAATQPKPQSNPTAPQGVPQLGVFNPADMIRYFIWMTRGGAVLAVVLSALGTFYGLQSKPAPLADTLAVGGDLLAAPNIVALAVVVQAALAVGQWGAWAVSAQWRREGDSRWRWALVAYGIALVVSVAYNMAAYYSGLVALGLPWWATVALVIGFDIFPERSLMKGS